MKQGKQFMKAIMLVLALMVASYILYNVVRSASSGVPTAQAVLYAASDGVSVEGFVVRQETVIPAAYDLVLPTKGEGEKVACGEEVAVTLRSAAAQERQEEINQTEKELEQLRLALAYQSQLTDNEDVAQRIASSAASLAGQVAQRRLDAARTAAGPHGRPGHCCPAAAAAGQFGGQRCFRYQIHRRPVRRVLLRRGRRL